jgi:carboxylate-amine ligase
VTDWSDWCADPDGPAYSLGVEEEVMLLHPSDWSLAQAIDEVLEVLPEPLAHRISSETHSAAVELRTGVHATVAGAVADLGVLRGGLTAVMGELRPPAAVAGTHPSAVWQDMVVAGGERHQAVHGSMRALARREPTFALHVHVGLPTGEAGIAAANRVRAHLPMLLALSANSPFWQGRDTGLASARTPLFQAFPRVGIPRAFGSYGEYAATIDLLLRTEAVTDPTHLWWDVRPQPPLGTVEVRIMDAQSDLPATAALVALVQCLVRLETTEGYVRPALVHAPEVLDENRFIAARDGVDASLIDPILGHRVPLREIVGAVLEACAPHATDLDCAAELAGVETLLFASGAGHQRRIAAEAGLDGLVAALVESFAGAPWPARRVGA